MIVYNCAILYESIKTSLIRNNSHLLTHAIFAVWLGWFLAIILFINFIYLSTFMICNKSLKATIFSLIEKINHVRC